MNELTPLEAQRQNQVLETVLDRRQVPLSDLPGDVVASLTRAGLLDQVGGQVVPTIAARHFLELLEAR